MHPIIALWAHPRSLSTAFERMMRERGDLTCFHEPFMYDFYVHRAVRAMPLFDLDPDHPVSYEAIRDHLFAQAEKGPIFIKDMSFYVVPRIFEDRALAEAVTHTFLIRHPVKSIPSFFKLDNGITNHEIGYLSQLRHVEWWEETSGRPAIIADAEAVQRDPRAVMTRYWEALGLPFIEDAFHWDTEEMPADWEQVAGWHGKVSSSGRILTEGPDEMAARQATFDAAAEKAPHLHDYLRDHLPAYEALKRRADDFLHRS